MAFFAVRPFVVSCNRDILFGNRGRLTKTHVIYNRKLRHIRLLSNAYMSAEVNGNGASYEQSRAIYLDYNATTPIHPEVAKAMLPFVQQHFGNPSSTHMFGKATREALATARQQVASAINAAHPSEVVFMSSGTEADNTAIYGIVMAQHQVQHSDHAPSAPPHVVTSNIEHPAITQYLHYMAAKGWLRFTEVPANTEGLVCPEAVAAAVEEHTVLVTIMHSNNEVGSVQPIADIVAAVRGTPQGAYVAIHTDAAQSLGKVPVDVASWGVDLATVVGHKVGAPKGIAALYIRHGVRLEPLLHGGGQEGGLRPGTQNVLLAVGLGRAAELAAKELQQRSTLMAQLRERMVEHVRSKLPKDCWRVNGPADEGARLPNTLSLSVKGILSSTVLDRVGNRVGASAGSACHSGGPATLSSVLQAIQVQQEWGLGTFRLSVGYDSTPEQVDAAMEILLDAIQSNLAAVTTS